VRLGSVALITLLAAGACARAGDLAMSALRPSEPPLEVDASLDLLAPDGLHVTSTEDRQITLAWEPVLVGDVAGYAVKRSEREAGAFTLVGHTGSRFETVFTDAGRGPGRLGDGEDYFYRVYPFDSGRHTGQHFATASATTDPRPAPPEGLETYSNLPRRAVLRWEASQDRSVSGYAVYRSPSAAGPWELVEGVEGRLETIFEDEIPGDLRVMYYRLRALNRFGGESEMSDPVRAVTKPEPLPPMGVRLAHRGLGEIVVAWRPNVEPDIVRYEVFRETLETGRWSGETQIAEVPASRERLDDREVGCGQRVRYRVRARDADGLQSAFSEPLETSGEDIGLRVEQGVGASELRWREDLREQGWTGARIVERFRLRPDRLLGELRGESSLRLDALSPGVHRLVVTLTRDDDADTERGTVSDAPPCTFTVELPAPSPVASGGP
jgi:hypothetical protein